MAITYEQALNARTARVDVFIPNGDAGELLDLVPLLGAHIPAARVCVAPTGVRDCSDSWYPLTDLDTAETLHASATEKG